MNPLLLSFWQKATGILFILKFACPGFRCIICYLGRCTMFSSRGLFVRAHLRIIDLLPKSNVSFSKEYSILYVNISQSIQCLSRCSWATHRPREDHAPQSSISFFWDTFEGRAISWLPNRRRNAEYASSSFLSEFLLFWAGTGRRGGR